MQITLEHELKNVSVFLDEMRQRALINAARMSMNRAIVGVAGRANTMIREQRKLKASVVRQNFKVSRAKGNNLATMQASLSISGKPMSMIHFVLGKQAPRNQKGIKVAKRKRLQFEVRPGKVFTIKSAFIARGKNSNYHVFQKHKGIWYKEARGGLSAIASREEFKNALQAYGKERLGVEFKQALDFEMAKAMAKARGASK